MSEIYEENFGILLDCSSCSFGMTVYCVPCFRTCDPFHELLGYWQGVYACARARYILHPFDCYLFSVIKR